MFTGRPPGLSHRYQSCPLPLDLSHEVLLAGGDVLQQAISNLNEDGWNTEGRVYDSTICRQLGTYSMILDEIMEVLLGTHAQFSLERVQSVFNVLIPKMQLTNLRQLKIKVHEDFLQPLGRNWAQLSPGQGTTSKEYILDPRNADSSIKRWRLLRGRLDYLRINFLLERLLTERGGIGKNNLLEVARELLDLTVFLWVERERWVIKHHYFDYMVKILSNLSISKLLKLTTFLDFMLRYAVNWSSLHSASEASQTSRRCRGQDPLFRDCTKT